MIKFPSNTVRTKQIHFYLLLHVPCFPCLSLSACSAGGLLASHFACSSVPASGASIAPESDVDTALIRVCVISSAPCKPDSISSLDTQFLQLPVHTCLWLWGIEASWVQGRMAFGWPWGRRGWAGIYCKLLDRSFIQCKFADLYFPLIKVFPHIWAYMLKCVSTYQSTFWKAPRLWLRCAKNNLKFGVWIHFSVLF